MAGALIVLFSFRFSVSPNSRLQILLQKNNGTQLPPRCRYLAESSARLPLEHKDGSTNVSSIVTQQRCVCEPPFASQLVGRAPHIAN